MAEFHIVSYEISNYNLYAIFFSILKIVDLVLLSIFIPDRQKISIRACTCFFQS